MTDKNKSAGKEVYPIRPGENRPRLDYSKYGYRTNKEDFGIFVVKPEWRLANKSNVETVKATFFPNVMWVIALNSIFVGALSATQQNAAAIILSLKLKFTQLGLVVLPVVVATPFVWFFGGYLADKISNMHAKKNGGQREPEAHLISLVFPLLAGIAGPLLFGYAGEHTDQRPLGFVLAGFFLTGFGGLTMNTLVSVYLVESYPNYAGYVFAARGSPLFKCFSLHLSTNNISQTCTCHHVLIPPHRRLPHQLQGRRLDPRTRLPQDLRHLQRHHGLLLPHAARHVLLWQAHASLERRQIRGLRASGLRGRRQEHGQHRDEQDVDKSEEPQGDGHQQAVARSMAARIIPAALMWILSAKTIPEICAIMMFRCPGVYYLFLWVASFWKGGCQVCARKIGWAGIGDCAIQGVHGGFQRYTDTIHKRVELTNSLGAIPLAKVRRIQPDGMQYQLMLIHVLRYQFSHL